MSVENKVCLIVIDGWGIPGPESPPEGDAIAAAYTPTMDRFAKSKTRYVELDASSTAVGLPKGQMGNSEVGHTNIGAGRVCWTDVVRIDHLIETGEFSSTPAIKGLCERAKNGNGRIHFCGLISHGGVHSKQLHLYALLKTAKEHGLSEVFIHFFGDGRDTDPKSGASYMEELLETIKDIGVGKLGTVVGRYYAMDRDKRWERTEIAMKALVLGEGEASEDPVTTVKERYEKGETDEFLKPIVVNGDEARIKDGDGVLFFNYRNDRVRQITQLLGDQERDPLPDFPYPDIKIVTMTQYKTDFNLEIAFHPQVMTNVLAEWLSKNNIRQVHVAETEKYPHVTFFFNGGVEVQFPLEARNRVKDLLPSIKSVPTYDYSPRMSASKVADRVCERLEHGFPFVMNNFAPPDMVGHTGKYEAAIVGCAATDKAIQKIWDACKKYGYMLFITADHGNAEEMKFPDGKPKTSHTTNLVPFIMAIPNDNDGEKFRGKMLKASDEDPDPLPTDEDKEEEEKKIAKYEKEVVEERKKNWESGADEDKKTEEDFKATREESQKAEDAYEQGKSGWKLKENGVLGDVAPTILSAMGLPIPEEMTGTNLLVKE